MPRMKFEIEADIPDDLEPTGEFRVADCHVDTFIGDNGMICRGERDRLGNGIHTCGPRLILRPVWKWPEWLTASWIAMDSDGEWAAFIQEPSCYDYSWAGVGWIPLKHTTFTPPPRTDWRQSKRQKPL